MTGDVIFPARITCETQATCETLFGQMEKTVEALILITIVLAIVITILRLNRHENKD